MSPTLVQVKPTSNRELVEIIEPLANYICATNRPRKTLLSALAVLFEEVEGTNNAALMHFATLRADALGLAS